MSRLGDRKSRARNHRHGCSPRQRDRAPVDNACHVALEPLEPRVLLSANAEVVGRYLFYNNSMFDGFDPAANANDDAAIAVDIQPLLPGQTSTAANFSNFSRGANGVMIDIADLGDANNLGVDDFSLWAGTSSDFTQWDYGTPPASVTVRPGEGAGGSDRVTLIWFDDINDNTWLRVTVNPTPDTGLAEPDIFVFGNVVGDTDGNAEVNITDFNELAGNFNVDPGGEVSGHVDFNRDGRVDISDFNALASNFSVMPILGPITLPQTQAAIVFNGTPISTGGLGFVFDRDFQTLDSAGQIVAADSPRYGHETAVAAAVSEDILATVPGPGKAVLLATGVDVDGLRPMIFGALRGGQEGYWVAVNDQITILPTNTTDLLDGQYAGFDHGVRGARIEHGVIVVSLTVMENGVSKYDTVAYSFDHGATWSLADVVPGDESAVEPRYPDPTPNSEGSLRGQQWSLTAVTDMQAQPLEMWLHHTDYLDSKKGGRHRLIRFTRTTVNDPWTAGKLRTIYANSVNEEFEGQHFHSGTHVVVNGDTYHISIMGDGNYQGMVLSKQVGADYETATFEHTLDWHGDMVNFGFDFVRGVQPTAIMQSPSGNPLLVADNEHMHLFEIDATSVLEDTARIIQLPYTTSQFEDGTVALFGHWQKDLYGYAATTRFARHGQSSSSGTVDTAVISLDGENFAAYGGNGTFYLIGGPYLIRMSGNNIKVVPRPNADSWQAVQPLAISPGGTNWLGDQFGLGLSGTLNDHVYETIEPDVNGIYHWPAGWAFAGQPLDPQPAGYGSVVAFKTDGTSASRVMLDLGESWPRLDGPGAPPYPSNARLIYSVHSPAHQTTTGLFFGGTAFQSRVARAAGGEWATRIANTASSSGSLIRLLSGASEPETAEFAIQFHQISSNVVTYPIDYEVIDAPDEKAAITGLLLDEQWGVAVSMGWPKEWESRRRDSHLFTLYQDDDNYIEVMSDKTNRFPYDYVATVVQDGAAVTELRLPFTSADLPHSTMWFRVGFNGIAYSFDVHQGSRDWESTLVAASSAIRPTEIRIGNYDQTDIVPVLVYGAGAARTVDEAETTLGLLLAEQGAPASAPIIAAALTAPTAPDSIIIDEETGANEVQSLSEPALPASVTTAETWLALAQTDSPAADAANTWLAPRTSRIFDLDADSIESSTRPARRTVRILR